MGMCRDACMVPVTKLFDRYFKVPTVKHADNFKKFQTYVGVHKITEIVTKDELHLLMKDLITKEFADKAEQMKSENGEKGEKKEADYSDDIPKDGEEAAVAAAAVEVENELMDQENAEEEATRKEELSVATTPDSVIARLEQMAASEDEDKLKRMVIEKRSEAYGLLKKEIGKISTFESQLRRNYFHVKPLEKSQLKAWKEYLDSFISREKKSSSSDPSSSADPFMSRERLLFLFERCAITCCYYDEYWLKDTR